MKKEINKDTQVMLDFLQDLKEERIKGIKAGLYVPIPKLEQGLPSLSFELKGVEYIKTREGNEHDLKEVEKRKNIEKLFESIENNDLKSVKECLAQGIDVKTFKDNIRDGYTPLMQSSYHGHIEIAKYLIEQGADVNAKCIGDAKGLTALMETCKLSCNTETAKLLIEKGADVNIKNKEGETALDIAIENPHSIKLEEKEELKDNVRFRNLIISNGGKRGIEIKPKAKAKTQSNDFGIGI